MSTTAAGCLATPAAKPAHERGTECSCGDTECRLRPPPAARPPRPPLCSPLCSPVLGMLCWWCCAPPAQHAEMRRKPAAGPPTQSPPTGRRLNHSDCSTRPSRRGTHPPAASPSRARLPAPKRWSSAFPASPAPPARRTAARPRAARRRPPPPRGRRRREGCRRLGGAAWRPVQGGGTPSLAGGPPGRWRRRGNGRAGR